MKKTPALLGSLLLLVAIPLIAFFVFIRQSDGKASTSVSGSPQAQIPTTAIGSPQTQTPLGNTPMPLISRNVHVFASSENYPATNANDTSYDTTWRSQGTPAW